MPHINLSERVDITTAYGWRGGFALKVQS